MGDMLKMAREMQGQMKKLQGELKHEVFEANCNGVVVKVSGDMEIKEVKIDPELVDPKNVGRLEKTVKEAAGKAFKDAKDGAARKMKGVTGGMGLPPGMM